MAPPGLWQALGVSVAVLLIAGLAVLRFCAAEVYDTLIVDMTARWYFAVVSKLKDKAHVLDIGIGTASALCSNAPHVLAQELTFVGVDYDEKYIEKAKKVVRAAKLQDKVELRCLSVYDENLRKMVGDGFDAVYFSGSFTLMPDPLKALQCTAKLLKPGGLIYITQTYQKRHTPLLGTIKPLLKYITTIDFGQLTYEADIQRILDESGMEVLENGPIAGSIDTYFQVAKIIVLRPKA